MSRTDAQRLVAAAAFAAEIHHGQCRDEGTPYLEHPLRVARIAADEIGISDPELLIAALLHDTLEDADDPEAARRRIREEFGERVLEVVELLTKPSDDGTSKEARDREYHSRLQQAPREVQALKIADRLDNTRFLIHSPDSKKRGRYLRETEEEYLPLAEKAGVLVEPLREATRRVRELYGPPPEPDAQE
ncbi:MAG: HD domain-containing protein [Armatimonadota bacterium]